MIRTLRVLLLEDDSADAELIELELRRGSLTINFLRVESREEFVRLLTDYKPQLILSDFSLRGFNGTAALRLAQEACPDIPFILVTGVLGEEQAVEWLKMGGTDVVLKQHLMRLNPAIERALREADEKLERNRVQEALLRSEEQYRQVVESVNDAIISVDARSTILFSNSGAARIFGYEVAEMQGKSLTMLMPEFFRPVHREAMKRYVKTGVRHMNWTGVEMTGLHKDGHEFPLEVSISELRQNDTLTFTGIIRDITERRWAEAANLRLAAIVESSDDAIIGKTVNGTIVSWNAAARRIFGYTEEEVKGRSISILARPERADEIAAILEASKTGDRIQHYVTECVRKDGTRIDVSLTISPIKNRSGKLVGSSTIARDITDRKQAEEILRESEQKYRALFNNLNDAVFLYEIGENGTPGRFIEVNDSACRMLNYDRSEMLLKTRLDIEDERRTRELTEMVERGSAAEGLRFNSLLRPRTGEPIHVEISAHLFSLKGSRVVLSIARDITQRKRTEEEREKLIHDLQEALAQVKTLVGLLPICAWCKKVRDDEGYWEDVESYLQKHSQIDFSHGICPDCARKYKGEFIAKRGRH
jgi:PAS domain S-box-containing protein